MTIDEAIKHAEEVAEEHERHLKVYENMDEDRPLFREEENECKDCAAEHRQLAKWLKDYKRSKEQEHTLDKIRDEIKALSPEPTAYDVVDGNPIKDAVWETLADVLKIIDKYKAEMEIEE